MIHNEIDIDNDWVILPDNGFLETKHDPEPKIHGGTQTNCDTKLVFLTDYFNPESGNEKIKEADIGSVEADDHNKEVKTQEVPFIKPAYNESADIMDSPKSSSEGFIPQIDGMGTFNFDGKIRVLDEIEKEEEDDSRWEGNSTGLSFWKRSFNGVGAICSFGFAAAATFCIIILGNKQRNRRKIHDQKLFFEDYSDEKRRKQMVNGTSKLNEAICAFRVPIISRAHITLGGYYNAL